MTSIAVTASICASASEVALLVASFMPFPPRIWTRLIVIRERTKTAFGFTSERPASTVHRTHPLNRRTFDPGNL